MIREINNYTKLEMDLFILIISKYNEDQTKYTFNVKNIMKLLNKGRTNYRQVTEGFLNLSKKSLIIYENDTLSEMRLIDEIEFDHVLSDYGFLRFEIPYLISPHLTHIKKILNKTTLNDFFKLSSRQSKKLWLFFIFHKEKNNVKIGINNLQRFLGVNYKDTPKFIYSIKKQIDVIESTTNLKNIKVEKHKNSRSISHLTFKY